MSAVLDAVRSCGDRPINRKHDKHPNASRASRAP
jgi:hypothetical protein